MSKAAKCDRCGAFYLRDRITDESVISTDATHVFQELELSYRDCSGISHAAIRYDLCPECRKKLKVWLLNSQVKDRSDWIEC